MQIVAIVDMKNKEMLDLNYQHKFATRTKLVGQWPTEIIGPSTYEFFEKFLDRLAKLADKDAQFIGDQKLDGKDTHVYQLTHFVWDPWHFPEGKTAKLWADGTINLPVRIEVDLPDHESIVLSSFVWDEPIDPALFNPEIPEGFKVGFSETPSK